MPRMSFHISSITHHLADPTQFFGLKLWITIVICIASLILIILFFTSLCFSACRRRRPRKLDKKHYSGSRRTMDRRLLSQSGLENQPSISSQEQVVYSDDMRGSRSGIHVVDMQPVVKGNSGRCENYGGSEIELATDGFSPGNMIGSGEHGVVYRGVLLNNKRVAVKKLTSKSMEVERFIEEVEAIWCIRHKNLVKLLGYSVDGAKRMLVYEYVDNGNLHQWLHGCTSRISPLTWSIRMRIILGITKGLAYLHEDSEPTLTHQRLKSGSILLDHQWNPKISDIGIIRLLGPEQNQSVTHNLIGMSGYLAPEYVSTYNFNEKSDVYSFGVLVMEIISGRIPMEYNQFDKKEYLVEWLKWKVSNQKFDDIVDERLQEPPSLKELKRIILIALRCVDPDIESRPTMAQVIHMLQPRDLLLDDDSDIIT